MKESPSELRPGARLNDTGGCCQRPDSRSRPVAVDERVREVVGSPHPYRTAESMNARVRSSPRPRLILASASAARAELLRAAGFAFRKSPTHCPEPPPRRGESPRAYALRLARLKANAALRRHPRSLILAADTIVVHRGRCLGKPADAAEAVAMLKRLGGETHMIITALCLMAQGPAGRPWRCEGIALARVSLRSWPAERLRRHVSAVRPFFCAGGYALQHGGSALIRRIQGDPTTVIGLPLDVLDRLLARMRARGALTTPPPRNAKSAATRHIGAPAHTNPATSQRPAATR